MKLAIDTGTVKGAAVESAEPVLDYETRVLGWIVGTQAECGARENDVNE